MGNGRRDGDARSDPTIPPSESSTARMTPEFDPDHKWLGIPPKDQPPNHYRLLGLDLFESDQESEPVSSRSGWFDMSGRNPYIDKTKGTFVIWRDDRGGRTGFDAVNGASSGSSLATA